MELIGKLIGFVSKYRYVVLVLLIGLALMLLPGKTGKDTTGKIPQSEPERQQDITQELTQILGQIKGAGKVKVMLTIRTGQTTVYQSDESIDSGENGSVKTETVIITDENRNQSGLIQQVKPPEYLGAIIVCEGADSAAVRLNIMEAVSKVTGLGADKISVLKMK